MYIIIVDYVCGKATIKDIPEEFEDWDGDDIVRAMGFKLKDVSYMIVDSSFDIDITTKNLTLEVTLK
jgi:hypothetical protein